MVDRDGELHKAVNDSGFPLQLGLSDLIKEKAPQWRLATYEHPWRDALSQDDKFVDIVLEKDDLVLVLECKRARDTDWIFLAPKPGPIHTERSVFRAFLTAHKHSGQLLLNDWCDIQVNPVSPIAEYCVIRKNGQRSQDLIERAAAELIRASEALADQQLRMAQRAKRRLSRVYLPVIVTTARLATCEYSATAFDGAIGEFSSSLIKEVSLLRFSKAFGVVPDQQQKEAASFDELQNLSGRNVWVVSANTLIDFLDNLEAYDLNRFANILWGS